VNEKGWGTCFSCGHTQKHGDTPTVTIEKKQSKPVDGNGIKYQALKSRGLTEETCKFFKYGVKQEAAGIVQVAQYYDGDGNVIAQKMRTKDKEFFSRGDMQSAVLFGQNIWEKGGKRVVITEGEIDCMTVSQVQGNKWPVVSLKNGSKSAVDGIKKNIEWLESFEEVIIMFDNDEPGLAAVQEVLPLFSPGKVKVATTELKDANEMLLADKVEELKKCIWNAKTFRPDGIVNAKDTLSALLAAKSGPIAMYPWEQVNEVLKGIRSSELVTITAGSGIGKSTIVREIAYSLLKDNHKVGMIMLEESVVRSVEGLIGIHLNKPIHISRDGVTNEQLVSAHNSLFEGGNLFLYDHFGSTGVDTLLSKIRYLAKAEDCRIIFLDHLSIVVSGQSEGDERRMIDNAMTALRSLVQELDIALFVVSHLRRPEGNKGHEEGARVTLSQLRGSHSIVQLSDIILGGERDQQGDDPNCILLRCLKNRFTGETGEVGKLKYWKEIGRLSPSS
jgi:twinkle protein